MKKLIVLGLVTIMMGCSIIGCGKKEEEKVKLYESSDIEDSESEDESEELEDSEVSTEFELPCQEDFKPVDGLSTNYADLENRSFSYNGKIYTLGKTTLKEMIDDGVAFDEDDLKRKDDEIDKNMETDSYNTSVNEYVNFSCDFINITDGAQKVQDCVLSTVRYYPYSTPLPTYDAEYNKEISENILKGSEKLCFSFPLTLTRDQLLENNSQYTDIYNNNKIEYFVSSEVYYGRSGYSFTFQPETGFLSDVYISWLP